MRTVGAYADFARTPGGLLRPTPEPGEHTREILAEYGVAADRVRGLFDAGAVFEWAPAEAPIAATS